MSISPEKRGGRQRGSILVGIMVMVFVVGLAIYFSEVNQNQHRTASVKVKGTRFSVMFDSGVETMVMAYRLAEISYNIALGSCATGTANPFLDALAHGHNCPGLAPVAVFGNNDAAGLNIANLYSYVNPGGCVIDDSGLKCGPKRIPTPLDLITIGAAAAESSQLVDGYSIAFTMSNVQPTKELVEFSAKVTDPRDGKFVRRLFAIRGTLPNAAHLEADGRVTQEMPDPLSRCPGQPWATFQIYNPDAKTCQNFGKLGSGLGLAYYNYRFFGFRPADGQVVDLLASGGAADAGYLVEPTTGATCAGCPQIFPIYDMATLTNADDITLLGDQIYYISRMAGEAEIGYLSMDGSVLPTKPQNPPAAAGTPARVPLCPLGALGWGQAYVGLASLDWSDPLIQQPGDADRTRLATFLAKTDAGSMLTVTVRSAKGAAPAADPSCLGFKLKGADYYSCCNVFKDGNIQQVEYARTLGFDRTDTMKPYYIY